VRQPSILSSNNLDGKGLAAAGDYPATVAVNAAKLGKMDEGRCRRLIALSQVTSTTGLAAALKAAEAGVRSVVEEHADHSFSLLLLLPSGLGGRKCRKDQPGTTQ
jgi:hypothetical protein